MSSHFLITKFSIYLDYKQLADSHFIVHYHHLPDATMPYPVEPRDAYLVVVIHSCTGSPILPGGLAVLLI